MSFAPTLKPIEQMKQGEVAAYGSDQNLMVIFERRAILNSFKSETEGKPVFEDRDYITITSPGAKTDMVREVYKDWRGDVPPDTERWPRQWVAFQKQEVQVHDGIPLDAWPPLGMAPAAIKGFKAADIFTVEQLSGLPDSALQAVPVMDARKWRDLAIKYCEQASGGKPIAALQAENTTLKQQMAIMQEQIEALAANQKKSPGRPPAHREEDD